MLSALFLSLIPHNKRCYSARRSRRRNLIQFTDFSSKKRNKERLRCIQADSVLRANPAFAPKITSWVGSAAPSGNPKPKEKPQPRLTLKQHSRALLARLKSGGVQEATNLRVWDAKRVPNLPVDGYPKGDPAPRPAIRPFCTPKMWIICLLHPTRERAA